MKKSTVARIASATTPAARRADETMLGHRGGGATKQMASYRRKTGHRGFFHSLSAQLFELCLEDHEEIALSEGLFEETQSPSYPAEVERVGALA